LIDDLNELSQAEDQQLPLDRKFNHLNLKVLLARLHDETRILNRLVDDLNELSQAEVRQLPLDREPIHLALIGSGRGGGFQLRHGE
jgi:signal transduction histidine kinase